MAEHAKGPAELPPGTRPVTPPLPRQPVIAHGTAYPAPYGWERATIDTPPQPPPRPRI
jgi:hypothetical protein